MQSRWFSFVLGSVVGLSLMVLNTPETFAQKGGGHSGGHSSSGAHHSGGGGNHHGGSWNGHNHGGFGVGVYLGGYGGYGYYPYYGYGYGSSYAMPYVYDAYPAVNYNTYQSFYVPPATGPGSGPAPDAGPVVNVAINDGSFSPGQLEIKSGTTVRFTNIGQQVHGLAQPQRDWKSQPISSGKTYTWNFKEPGTYTLYDATDPNVKMKVVVE